MVRQKLKLFAAASALVAPTLLSLNLRAQANPNGAPAKPPAAEPAKPPAAEPAKPSAEPAKAPEPTAPAAEVGSETEPAPADAPSVGADASASGSAASTRGTGTVGILPNWGEQTQGAAAQKQTAAASGKESKATSGEVFAEDWWSHTRPMLELHGYFRVRAELFHTFSLSRVDPPDAATWPRPSDQRYGTTSGSYGPSLCTPDETDTRVSDSGADAIHGCQNKTQSSANLRFRLNPELVISDNLRVISQIDLLDNLVLGSTPAGYQNTPAGSSAGYSVSPRSGYVPLGIYDNTSAAPASGINSLGDSISVKRAWAEYATPVGELRFGRMPSHWGLGIFQNAGDGHDDDYQSTVDRIAAVTGLKPLDLYLAGAWDFPNEGATSSGFSPPSAQPYDVAQLDDVDQWVLAVFRRKSPELEKLALAQGKLVLNGGVYLMHQTQDLANDASTSCTGAGMGGAAIGCDAGASSGFVRRGADFWVPDLWLQLLYKKFRFEAEAVTVQGSVENQTTTTNTSDFDNTSGDDGWTYNQWALATEIEQKLVEDKLRLEFKFGWASGDPDVDGLAPDRYGIQAQHADRTISTFRFHPAYRLDMILYRNILTRVQGTYYFRPSVEYDFLRNDQGQRLGGGFAAIWSRASEFIQSPGHERDLGIELNGRVWFQSKDGSFNDQPGTMGGFYTALEYGVLFPLGGLGYQSVEAANIDRDLRAAGASDTGTAQVLRWYLGVLF